MFHVNHFILTANCLSIGSESVCFHAYLTCINTMYVVIVFIIFVSVHTICKQAIIQRKDVSCQSCVSLFFDYVFLLYSIALAAHSQCTAKRDQRRIFARMGIARDMKVKRMMQRIVACMHDQSLLSLSLSSYLLVSLTLAFPPPTRRAILFTWGVISHVLPAVISIRSCVLMWPPLVGTAHNQV